MPNTRTRPPHEDWIGKVARARLANVLGADHVRDASILVVSRSDRATPVAWAMSGAVAFLVSYNLHEPTRPHYVLPLVVGPNLIGRRHGPHDPTPERLLEPVQWSIFAAMLQTAVLKDAGSTNGSFLLPKRLKLPAAELSDYMSAARASDQGGGPVRITPGAGRSYPLCEGDVLVALYSCFVFGLLPPSSG